MAVQPISQHEPIPGYRLIERLGRGGFGEVWKAEAPGGLLKAIKFVFGEVRESKEKASAGEQELRALNRIKAIRHPYILSLERVDIIDGQLIIVMELADRNLADRFQDYRKQKLPGIPREELLRYMEETAEALDLLNSEYQLQHLDIKPQNLFLVRNHVKVGDFGLVKDLAGMKASLTGGVTPVYAAPETFEGWVSHFCDQYSLAIVYQELLTGQRPFTGTSAGQLLKQHIEGTPDVSPLPPGDQPIICRALAKKPDERFPSCAALVQALRGAGTPPAPRATMTMEAIELPPVPSGGAATAESTPPLTKQPASHQSGSRGAVAEPRTDRQPTRSPVVMPTPAVSPAPSQSDTNRVGMQPAAPVEFKGSGVLYPALIVGIGQVGIGVLQKLREALVERFTTLEAVPHIRLLALDTDPDAIGSAARASKGAALAGRELLLTRLNRPTHFAKPREGQVAVDTWLNPHLIFRIPRNQQTAGMRWLGRLAFVDNYRDIADRLRGELAACTEADALTTADRQTKLGLRTNRPRVWVVASLAGGTGGGMFIDLAYLTRYFLKQLGYAQPDVTGLFFLPPPVHNPQRALAVGNTFAALAELNHFSTPGTTFTARYASKEPPLTDSDPPFGRCLLLPLEADDPKNKARAALAAGLLYRDLVTPLGRAADARRAEMSSQAQQTGLTVQAFGMNRLTWPRRALIMGLARQIGLRITQHWTNKDVGPLKSEVVAWAKEQWTKNEFPADQLLPLLKETAKAAMDDQAPEDVFAGIVEALVQKVPPGGNPEPGHLQAALGELEKLVGAPDDGRMPIRTEVMDALDKTAQELLGNLEQKLAEMAVHLVEQPRFRLAGAEEAIRQFNGFLQQALEQYETLCNDFITKSNSAYARLQTLLETLQTAAAARRKAPPVAGEVVDLLQVFPVLRLRGLILQRLLIVLRSLRGNCPEYLRELAFCRTRLLDLVKMFEKPVVATSALDLGPSRELFPPGCATLKNAVDRSLEQLTSDRLIELDGKVQLLLRKQFTALVHVCTTAANILPNVEQAMQHELEVHAAEHLKAANVVEMFLARYPKNIDACEEIVATHEKAASALAVEPAASPTELALVVIPAEEGADRFQELAERALEGATLVGGPKGDDIVFYRELSHLSLADLPQMGVEGKTAYEDMQAMEHFSAHCRTDITDWRLPESR